MNEALIQFSEWLMYYIGMKNLFYFPLLELMVILLFFRKNFWEATIWVFGIINLILLWFFIVLLVYKSILVTTIDLILKFMMLLTFPVVIAFIAAIIYFVIKKVSSRRPPPYQKSIAIFTLVFGIAGFFVGGVLEARRVNKNTPKGDMNISKGDMNTPKIDICQYDSKNIGELKALLGKRIVGSKNSNLKFFFQNTPVKERRNKMLHPKLAISIGIPQGKMHEIFYRCQLSGGNSNEWYIALIEDKMGMVRKLDTYLTYDDENFARRNEPLNMERVGDYVTIARAILGRNQTQHYGREKLRKEMLAGGFLFHRSCAYDEKVGDIYFTPPPPPDSVIGLYGLYLYPDPLPNVAIIFDARDGRLLEATPARGPASGRCKLFDHIYGEQFTDWILVNYPDSWASKEIKKKRAEKQR